MLIIALFLGSPAVPYFYIRLPVSIFPGYASHREAKLVRISTSGEDGAAALRNWRLQFKSVLFTADEVSDTEELRLLNPCVSGQILMVHNIRSRNKG